MAAPQKFRHLPGYDPRPKLLPITRLEKRSAGTAIFYHEVEPITPSAYERRTPMEEWKVHHLGYSHRPGSQQRAHDFTVLLARHRSSINTTETNRVEFYIYI